MFSSFVKYFGQFRENFDVLFLESISKHKMNLDQADETMVEKFIEKLEEVAKRRNVDLTPEDYINVAGRALTYRYGPRMLGDKRQKPSFEWRKEMIPVDMEADVDYLKEKLAREGINWFYLVDPTVGSQGDKNRINTGRPGWRGEVAKTNGIKILKNLAKKNPRLKYFVDNYPKLGAPVWNVPVEAAIGSQQVSKQKHVKIGEYTRKPVKLDDNDISYLNNIRFQLKKKYNLEGDAANDWVVKAFRLKYSDYFVGEDKDGNFYLKNKEKHQEIPLSKSKGIKVVVEIGQEVVDRLNFLREKTGKDFVKHPMTTRQAETWLERKIYEPRRAVTGQDMRYEEDKYKAIEKQQQKYADSEGKAADTPNKADHKFLAAQSMSAYGVETPYLPWADILQRDVEQAFKEVISTLRRNVQNPDYFIHVLTKNGDDFKNRGFTWLRHNMASGDEDYLSERFRVTKCGSFIHNELQAEMRDNPAATSMDAPTDAGKSISSIIAAPSSQHKRYPPIAVTDINSEKDIDQFVNWYFAPENKDYVDQKVNDKGEMVVSPEGFGDIYLTQRDFKNRMMAVLAHKIRTEKAAASAGKQDSTKVQREPF